MNIQRAINFASYKHADQKRKASKLPYIVHLMEVMYLMQQNLCSEEVIMAGILHDTIEDTDTTVEELKQHFGERVTSLVLSNSENKSLSWKQRKTHTISAIKNLNDDEKFVLCADKLSNLNSIYMDLKSRGEDTWNKFNASIDETKWYYTSIVKELNKYMKNCRMLEEINTVCNEVCK